MNPGRRKTDSLVRVPPGDGFVGLSSPSGRSIPSGSGGQPVFRFDLARSLQLHGTLAIVLALAGVALATAYLFLVHAAYTAESIVYLQPAPPKVFEQQNTPARWPADPWAYEGYIQHQVLTVTRYDVLANAIRKLGNDPWKRPGESEQAAVERLNRALFVTRVGTGYQVSITASAPTADAAAHLANNVAASFVESATREEKSGDTERIAMLGEERERVQKELAADRAEQASLNKQLGVAAVANGSPDPYTDQMKEIRTELVKARADSDEAAARLTSMGSGKTASTAALDAAADQIVTTDAGLVSMKTNLSQRRAALASQMANLTPNHPLYKQDAEELKQIDASQDAMMKDLRSKAAARIQHSLHSDLERTGGVETRLNQQLGQLAAVAVSATPKLQRASDLSTDIVRLQQRFATVDEQFHNRTLEDAGPSSIQLAAAAVPPLHPAKSGRVRNSLLIAVSGLLFGLMAAMTANKLDTRIYMPSDVEQVVGYAPMGQLPNFNQVSDGVAQEHVLRLAAAIEHASKRAGMMGCVFTGAAPGAGVSTVASRVNEMLGAMGRETVLVNASGGEPVESRSMHAPAGMDDSSRELATHSGSRSTALRQQMDEEAQAQSLVITDTAPLLVSAETEYLTRFADATIVVVESGRTTRAQLREVAAALQRLQAPAVGFVLNRIGLEKASPAFRASVRAMEEHLDSQTKPSAWRADEPRPIGAEVAAAAAFFHEKAAAAEAAAPRPQEPVARAEAPAQPAPPAASKRPAVPTETAASRPRGPWIPQADEETRQPEPMPAAAPARHVPQPIRQQEAEAPRPAASAPPFKAAETPPAEAVPRLRSEAPPAQAWERAHDTGLNMTVDAAREIQEPDHADTHDTLASRLSSLRNLRVMTGLRNLNQAAEMRTRQEDAQRYEPEPRGPVYADAAAGSISSNAYDTADRPVVTARPEILPPKPRVETTEPEHGWESASNSRRDRRAAYDDVDILPSVRGQYKKKRT